ncbi:MAG: DUF721 domain-containing protein [Candidatus Cloacimonas sp.]
MAFSSISQLSEELMYRLGGDKYRSFIHIFLYWKEVVGELLASKSYPEKLENGVLFVAVQNNTWMQELILIKDEIISKYKSIYKEEIAEIVFLISSPKRKCKKHK